MIDFVLLENKTHPIAIVGMGYVGLPLALALAKHFDVIGYDIDTKKIDELKQGVDRTGEMDETLLQNTTMTFTDSAEALAKAKVIIVAVPTPIDSNNIPDLRILRAASQTVGEHLSEGTVVVYESTVYPGLTEDVCVPILEQASGLTIGDGFSVGYSPERVNPGDKERTIETITKVVAGYDDQTAELLCQVYGKVTETFKATSIRVAEAAKVIENTQRDLNIALMNELAVLFNKMDISIYDVLEAAGTKWNFLPFTPGLVGGHCIGVDPYYLTYKAQAVGHNPELILAGRGLNDRMHQFIAHEVIKSMISLGKDVSKSTVVVYGMTFKENVSDIRNSKVAALIQELKAFGIRPQVYDPLANPEEVKEEYGIELVAEASLDRADALIVAVGHDVFASLSVQQLKERMNSDAALLVDIKHLYTKDTIEQEGITYWSL